MQSPGGGVLQKASDYLGILPQHEFLGKDYNYKGQKETKFTYHHIIPENFLNEISDIITWLGKDVLQTCESCAFQHTAVKLRENTRIKNTYLGY